MGDDVAPWILFGVVAAIYVVMSTLETAGRISLYQASVICGGITLVPLTWIIIAEQWLILTLAVPTVLAFIATGWITRPRKERP